MKVLLFTCMLALLVTLNCFSMVQTASAGYRALVQNFIVKCLSPNTMSSNQNSMQSKYGTALLHCAVEQKNSELIQLLLTAGVDINAQDDDGWTALHIAIIYGDITLVKLLLSFGAEVNSVNRFGRTPLDYAADGSNLLIQLLVEKGAQVNTHSGLGDTPLHWAHYQGHGKTITHLFDYGVFIINELVLIDDPVITRAQKRQTRLNRAFHKKDLKAILALLDKGAYGNNQVKKFIATKRQELFQAIACHKLARVRKLLMQGLSINTCDKQGNTLLHKAVVSKDMRIFKYLVALLHRVDTEKLYNYLLQKNSIGKTPLDLALESNQAFFKLLLHQKQDKQELDLAINTRCWWCTIT